MADVIGRKTQPHLFRTKVVRHIAGVMSKHYPNAETMQARKFLERYVNGLTGEALATQPITQIAEAALSLWSFIQQRTVGHTKIRMSSPGKHDAGCAKPPAVVEILSDNIPFLVDSALGLLQTFNRPVQNLVHSVLPMVRDHEGRLLQVGPETDPTALRESAIQIAFEADSDPVSQEKITAALKLAMADARAAALDATAMHHSLIAAMQLLPSGSPREFLGWAASSNFILLGVQEVKFLAGGLILAPNNGPSLGVLRRSNRTLFDVLLDPERWNAIGASVLARFDGVAITKADIRSSVYRPQLYDVIAIKRRNRLGAVIGLLLLAGLFSADTYTGDPYNIPLLAEKIKTILDLAHVDPDGYDGRALRQILNTWPRDDLFQGTVEEILSAAQRVMLLQLRPALALFLRHDLLSRHVSALLFVPRNRFDTDLRHKLAGMLTRALKGELVGYAVALGDGPLARGHFIIASDPIQARKLDLAHLEEEMVKTTRSFKDRLLEELTTEHDTLHAASMRLDWADAFPVDYTAHQATNTAVEDLAAAEAALYSDGFQLTLKQPPTIPPDRLILKLFHVGEPIALSDIVPLIESLGLRVIEEVPYRLTPPGKTIALQELTLETPNHMAVDFATAGDRLHDAILAAWSGDCEIDGFNRLVLHCGLTWREAWLFRAMFRWCSQVRSPFSQTAVENALSANPQATRALISLFNHRFNPVHLQTRSPDTDLVRAFFVLLDRVTDADDDRILRRFETLLASVVRTNFYCASSPVIALKLDSFNAGDIPSPRPMTEIFVHGPRMEGCHLRAGQVARGGIRWSDRKDDFRTEVLDLLKAQMLKNVVIVPVGAKGGFIVKNPPAPTGNPKTDREALAVEGLACYKLMINAMLDITDTICAGQVIPPSGIVRRDGDDPYLVVAADKGTASFSDTANDIAIARGFWLGDAFASGGSIGYDHKAMGITARGAWINIFHHFSRLGKDIRSTDFSCAGVGDMSGDVFGNGLLMSRHTRLLAAFDHRHIFLDPDPDPELSYLERRRLFGLPQSSWADYDGAKISVGGAVFSRQAKHVSLSDESAAMLGLSAEALEPAAVIRAILMMKIDLLYFGGIGTYIKASTETDAEVGDRTNDFVRINGKEVRARVIGEGANLALTQSGRIEAALAGTKLNTDSLDNSAGVSTSDHEVNIKIVLSDAMASGHLDPHQRVDLLEEMTESVAELVLRDNYLQSTAISLDELGGVSDMLGHDACMRFLEEDGILDRDVASLPDAADIKIRRALGKALTRPELCTLMAHAKLHLSAVLDISSLVDDAALTGILMDYFPLPFQKMFGDEIGRHRLRRGLIATALTNDLVNRMGTAALGWLAYDSRTDLAQIVRAALITKESFDLPSIYSSVEKLTAVPVPVLLTVLLAARQLLAAGTRILLKQSANFPGLYVEIATLRPNVSALVDLAVQQTSNSTVARALVAEGVPSRLAGFVAAVPELKDALMVARLTVDARATIEKAKSVWREVGAASAIETLKLVLDQISPQDNWEARAAAGIHDELDALQMNIAVQVLKQNRLPDNLVINTDPRASRAIAVARDAAMRPSLAAMTVAVRLLRQALMAQPLCEHLRS